MLLPRATSYDAMCRDFRWQVPAVYNIADDVCDSHADERPDAVALIVDQPNGEPEYMTFGEVRRHANRLASWLVDSGLQRGDRVALLLGQRPEAAITHVACWKAGLVSSPMSTLFGEDAVAYRLMDLGARVAITDRDNLPTIRNACVNAPELERVLVIDDEADDVSAFWEVITAFPESFTNVATSAEDLAFINYTSGTTGNPKGAMQPHRTMIGHAMAFEYLLDFFPVEGDVIWSPADWSWLAGLMNILMVGWYHGCPVVATARAGFDPEDACRVMHQHGVTTAMLTPTMLKLLRQHPESLKRYPPSLRAVVSGTESVGKELLQWAEQTLGCVVNEGYGQTECNAQIGTCARIMERRPGALGRPLPGHEVAVVDDEGHPVPPGTVSEIAVKWPDPIMMLGYWNRPEATREKFRGDWMMTGDRAYMDDDGYFWFQGRADDVITSSGYRIGPGEVEDTLLRHPAVGMAAVIGVPDPERTERIKAFIVLAPGSAPSDALKQELCDSVRERLARHEVPREIEFVDSLPMTVTGKVQRRALREREREREQAGR